MDGRQPPAIAYGVTGCDPAAEQEFDRWYRDVHFRDALAAGVYENPIMFHYTDAIVPAGEGRFLATYEIYDHNLEAVVTSFAPSIPRLQADYDAMGGRRVFGGFFHVLFRLFREGPTSRTNSLLSIRVDCTDEDARSLESWYREVCLPRAVDDSAFHTASLNAWADHQPAPGWTRTCKFLTLFESDRNNVVDLAPYLQAALQGAPAPASQETHSSTYVRAGAYGEG